MISDGDSLVEMPGVRRVIGGRGTTFREAFVVNPLCCPSRASILTGNYSHTTGVYTNFPPRGGVSAFDDSSTIATWLDDAGYRTGLVGKYMNGYATPWRVPPGWDRWSALLEGSNYYDYEMSQDGRYRRYGSAPADYSTDVFADLASNFIRTTPRAQPLFLFLTPAAPHHPRVPAPRYVDRAPLHRFVPGPSLPEADVSDKPAYIRTRRPIHRDPSDLWAAESLALRAVDDLVVSTFEAIRERGRLHETLFIFMSDNGFAFGEHRWNYKLTPYEESIRVPLVVRYDPLTRGLSTNAMAANIDVAPTIADIAGVDIPTVEGRSLKPVLEDPGIDVRRDLLIEHLQFRESGLHDPPTYCAVRTVDRLFVRYATGEEELYDLQADPHQLENLATDPARQDEADRLRALTRRRCRPPPPGFRW